MSHERDSFQVYVDPPVEKQYELRVVLSETEARDLGSMLLRNVGIPDLVHKVTPEVDEVRLGNLMDRICGLITSKLNL